MSDDKDELERLRAENEALRAEVETLKQKRAADRDGVMKFIDKHNNDMEALKEKHWASERAHEKLLNSAHEHFKNGNATKAHYILGWTSGKVGDRGLADEKKKGYNSAILLSEYLEMVYRKPYNTMINDIGEVIEVKPSGIYNKLTKKTVQELKPHIAVKKLAQKYIIGPKEKKTGQAMTDIEKSKAFDRIEKSLQKSIQARKKLLATHKPGQYIGAASEPLTLEEWEGLTP